MMRAISPRDCAIAVAVPSTRDEFMRAAAVARPGSFIGGLLGRPPRRPEWVWQHRYAPLAALIESVLNEAEDRGVTVVRRATVNDVARVIGSAQTLTLIAHWQFPGLSPADFIDPHAAAQAVSTASAGPLARIRELAEAAPPAPDPAHACIELMCREVAASEATFRTWEESGIVVFDGSSAEATRLHRIDLEEALPESTLRRARVVEFADDFQTAGSVLAAFPPDFTGVLDLLICNSAVLGVAARRRCPESTAILNKRRLPLVFAVARYRAIVKLLQQTPQPYIDAVHLIHRLLIEADS